MKVSRIEMLTPLISVKFWSYKSLVLAESNSSVFWLEILIHFLQLFRFNRASFNNLKLFMHWFTFRCHFIAVLDHSTPPPTHVRKFTGQFMIFFMKLRDSLLQWLIFIRQFGNLFWRVSESSVEFKADSSDKILSCSCRTRLWLHFDSVHAKRIFLEQMLS